MIFISAWIICPIFLLILCYGLGSLLYLRALAKPKLPITLLAGFSLFIVSGEIFTRTSISAPFTALFVLTTAVVGLILNRKQLRDSFSQIYVWITFFSTYILASLPVTSKLKPVWAGWVQLDDTATFLAVTDKIMKSGISRPKVVDSTYTRTLDVVLGNSYYGNYTSAPNEIAFNYPIGSLIPLGSIGKLINTDIAWLYFPFLVFCISLVAIIFYYYFSKVFDKQILIIFGAITSALASTYYAYALWGGIKELVLVPILFYLIFNVVEISDLPKSEEISKRKWLQLIISIISIYSVAGKSSIGFIVGFFVLTFGVRKLTQIDIRFNKKLIFLSSFLLIIISLLNKYFTQILNTYFIPKIPDGGNLVRAVNKLQILGIWPSGDFRGDIYWQPFSYFLLLIVISLILIGIFYSFRIKKYELIVASLTTLAIVLYSERFNGIWLTGKAIAIASPFFLGMAFIGSGFLISREKLKFLGFFAFLLLILGTSTSNYLAYRHTWIAPYEKVKELAVIGEKFNGQGPALMTDHSTFGARYFLRDLRTESASELRVNSIPMRDGSELKKGFSADIDLFDNSEISKYRLLVLRHSAAGSRPLFNYDLKYQGKYYDVWQLNDLANAKIRSIGLGNNYQPGQTISCEKITEFARSTKSQIYTSVREFTSIVNLADTKLPQSWQEDTGNFGAIYPKSSGTSRYIFEVTKDGDFQVFIAGSFGGKISIQVDNEEIYSGSALFEGNKYLTNYLSNVKLMAGKHLLTFKYSKSVLSSGSAVVEPVGPIYFIENSASKAKVIKVNSERASELCGKNLDWLATID